MDIRPAINAPFLLDIHDRLIASATQLENQASRLKNQDNPAHAELTAEARKNRTSASALIWTLSSFGPASHIPVHGLKQAHDARRTQDRT